jgi:uncharacterized protein (DUF1697 family)
MTAIVSMLRAVNLAGRNQIRMEALRGLCASLKLSDPRTYVQSGNVVFGTAEKNLGRLARRIEDAIEKSLGFRPDVMLRTAAEMQSVVGRNPFADRKDIEPARLLVVFLAAEPGPEACAKFLAIRKGREELRISGREAYIYYPDGMGRSKLTTSVIEGTLGTRGTARNWNTVLKLVDMLG